jgi:hypothetical protein
MTSSELAAISDYLPPLPLRIAAGVAIFAVLAALDYRKHGPAATRWREYLFLLSITAIAMLFGALNDQVSVTLSWEYFYYGKELSAVLGPDTPPAQLPLRVHAALIGIQATWSAGLLIAVALLLANNPRPNRPRLAYNQLLSHVPTLLSITIDCAALGAVLGYAGLLDVLDKDLADLRQVNLWRPARFIAAWGEHLGAYLGGLLGLTTVVTRVLRQRSRNAHEVPPQ